MLFALMFASPSNAAVGIWVDGSLQGTATDMEFKSIGGSLSNDGSRWTFNLLLAGVGSGGATSMTSSDLAVPVGFSHITKAISADPAFNAGTLADGNPGQILTLEITEQLGAETFTVTPATSTKIATLGFNAVGDIATLLFVDTTTGWAVLSQTSVTVTLP